jgi:hypothetical protein
VAGGQANNAHLFNGDLMLALNTIVYADIDPDAPIQPSEVAGAIAAAARNSLSAGRLQIAERPLSVADVRQSLQNLPTGHERVAPDDNLVLVGAGAMLAYAPYRGRLLLAVDPFARAVAFARILETDADKLRVRLHDSILSAEKIIALGHRTFDAILPFLPDWPQKRAYPTAPLRFSQAAAGILVVGNEGPEATTQVIALLRKELPSVAFSVFEPESVFAQPWRMVIHLGLVRDMGLGARLTDAWAGGVPVLQYVDPQRLDAQRRRQHRASVAFVEHGKTGLMFPTMEELVRSLGELLTDSLPARAVARNARYRVDPVAEWDALLTELVQ